MLHSALHCIQTPFIDEMQKQAWHCTPLFIAFKLREETGYELCFEKLHSALHCIQTRRLLQGFRGEFSQLHSALHCIQTPELALSPLMESALHSALHCIQTLPRFRKLVIRYNCTPLFIAFKQFKSVIIGDEKDDCTPLFIAFKRPQKSAFRNPQTHCTPLFIAFKLRKAHKGA